MFLRVPQKLGTFKTFCITIFIYNMKPFQNSINTWHMLQPTSIVFRIGTKFFPVSSVYSSWRAEVGLYILKWYEHLTKNHTHPTLLLAETPKCSWVLSTRILEILKTECHIFLMFDIDFQHMQTSQITDFYKINTPIFTNYRYF